MSAVNNSLIYEITIPLVMMSALIDNLPIFLP